MVLRLLSILLFLTLLAAIPVRAGMFEDHSQTRMLKPGEGASGITVSSYGITSLLISDGETGILLDGFFSRPRPSFLSGGFQPEPFVIDQSLEHLCLSPSASSVARARCPDGVRDVSLVIPVHGHYDHGLDSAYVAARLGARLFADDSYRRTIRATQELVAHLPNAPDFDALNIVPSQSNPQVITQGAFVVTLINTPHSSNLITRLGEGENPPNLDFPTWAYGLKQGRSVSVHIRHGARNILVVPSAGALDGVFGKLGLTAEVVFLTLAALDRESRSDRDAYWRHAVTETGARRVIPVHWDADNRRVFQVGRNFKPGFWAQTKTYKQFLTKTGAGVDMWFAPPLKPFDPFQKAP